MLFRLKFTFDLEGDTQFVLEKGFNSEKGEAITVKGNKVELEFSCNNLPTSVKIDFESDSNPNGKKDVSPKEEETTQKPTTKGEAQQIAQPVEKKVIVEDEVTFNFFYPQYLKSKSYDEFIKNINKEFFHFRMDAFDTFKNILIFTDDSDKLSWSLISENLEKNTGEKFANSIMRNYCNRLGGMLRRNGLAPEHAIPLKVIKTLLQYKGMRNMSIAIENQVQKDLIVENVEKTFETPNVQLNESNCENFSEEEKSGLKNEDELQVIPEEEKSSSRSQNMIQLDPDESCFEDLIHQAKHVKETEARLRFLLNSMGFKRKSFDERMMILEVSNKVINTQTDEELLSYFDLMTPFTRILIADFVNEFLKEKHANKKMSVLRFFKVLKLAF